MNFSPPKFDYNSKTSKSGSIDVVIFINAPSFRRCCIQSSPHTHTRFIINRVHHTQTRLNGLTDRWNDWQRREGRKVEKQNKNRENMIQWPYGCCCKRQALKALKINSLFLFRGFFFISGKKMLFNNHINEQFGRFLPSLHKNCCS